MSWSLELRNGDFTTGGSRLGTVVRQNKLVQDLRCALLEKMGTDNLHPGYGSLIDGGRTPEGVEKPGVIGETDLDFVLIEIQSEITRIARLYQRQQLNRAKTDRLTYGRATLEPEEVLINLVGIDFSQLQDQLVVTVSIQVASNDDFDLEVPITVPLNSIN